MSLFFTVAIWLIEHLSPSPNRSALCGDLLEQRHAGRSKGWLTRELLAALGIALMQRFGRLFVPILFSFAWSALYRGYASPQPPVLYATLARAINIFPLDSLASLFLQVAPVVAFIWVGFALFLSGRRDVVRHLTAWSLTLALTASHAALLLLVMLWPKHPSSSTFVPLLLQPSLYLGWFNLPLAISLLMAIVCVLPRDSEPPRRRRARKQEPARALELRPEPISKSSVASFLRAAALMIPLILLFGMGLASAQPSRTQLTAAQVSAIDSFVADEMHKEQIPGLELGIYSRGTVLLAKGYGLSNVELNVPVKPETVFQSGSLGKQFVSAAIMMLVEEGKLSLDDSVAKYFPNAPATWQPIRLKNLLSHTSGLSEYETPDRTSATGPFYLRLDFTEDGLVQKIEALPIENAPGERWNYRNTNYVLLGILIHRVTGVPYADFLAQRIFRPLGMTSTRLISEADIIPNRAAGYELHGSELKNQQWVSPTFNSTADGTLYFNVLDLARWDDALYSTRLLKQSSLDRMWTAFPLNNGQPNPGSYGFGWEVDPQNGHKRIEHGGAWQGFTGEISRYPDDAPTVIVLTNLDSAHARPAMFTHVIAGMIQPQLKVPRLEAITDNEPATAAVLRTILDKVVTRQDFRDQLSTELAKRLSPEAETSLQENVAPYWPGGSLTLVHRHTMPEAGDAHLSMYRLKKGDHAILVAFALTRESKVIALGFHPDSDF